jgi:hypothetical protein
VGHTHHSTFSNIVYVLWNHRLDVYMRYNDETLTSDVRLLVLAATKKHIRESKLFNKLVEECLIPKFAAGSAAKMLAATALVMALLAWWLVPTYLVVPLGATDAKSLEKGLLLWSFLTSYFASEQATNFMVAQSREGRVMKQGKKAFGDDFAAAVRAYHEEVLYDH